METNNQIFIARLKGFAKVISACVSTLGLLVILGWAFDVETLKRLSPSFVAMNPTSAVAFIFSGAALWLLGVEQSPNREFPQRLARLFSAIVVLIGALKLAGLACGWKSNVDQFLFHEKLAQSGGEGLSRMAPNTALNFLLIGISFLLLTFKAGFGRNMAQRAALTSTFLSWLAVMGYAYGAPFLYGLGTYIPMAFHTALAFLFLSVAVLCMHPQEGLMSIVSSPNAGGHIARRILPAIFLIESVIGWFRLVGGRNGYFSEEVGVALLVVSSIALGSIILLWGAASLNRTEAARQKIQGAFEKSVAEMEDLYNNSPCGYHAVDSDGIFLTINDTELTWRGYTREELIGKKKHRDLVSPATKAAYDKGFAYFKEHGEVKDLEFQLMRKDGSVMDVLLNATAMKDADGKILHSRSTMFDITERKKAEEERDRFFVLSLDMLCVAGMDGYFKRLNPAFQQTLGYTTEELLARPFLDFIHPDDRAVTLFEIEKLSQGIPSVRLENRYRCKDGSYKWLSWKIQPFPSEGLLYATGRDITESKEIDEKIDKLNSDLKLRAAELETANKELESFSYSVSHDLRAPLRHIAGFVNLLGDDLDAVITPKSKRFLKIIGESSRQMGQLIDALLVFSQMNRVELRQTTIDANQLVEDAITVLQPEIEGKNIIWKKNPLPELQGDAALLRQVFINLISNALKYSRTRNPQQIEIGHKSDGDELIIFVRDNGVGFDMQFAGKLFGVFQRLHQVDDFEGTGIGLANVRRIVHRHGGRTWAEGTVDCGATFYFSLKQERGESNLKI
jgi:PAS domain S-box-containing protein